MREISIKDAAKLVRSESKPSISIYLKTEVGEAGNEGLLRRNLQVLLKSAENLFISSREPKLKERLLGSLASAVQHLKLSRHTGGLAIYHREGFTRIARIPTPVKDLAVAAESFHLKPILRCLQLRPDFLLLAIKRKHAELYRVSSEHAILLDRLELKYELESTEKLQEDHDRRWRNFRIRKRKEVAAAMEALSRHLQSYWTSEKIPMLIAGHPRRQAIFRQVCPYMHIVPETILGPIDGLNRTALSKLARDCMQQHFYREDEMDLVAYRRAESVGLTITGVEEIALAAARGQIQRLFVAEDFHIWGRLDRSSGRVQVHSQETSPNAIADDVLDDLAELTLLKGGKVKVFPSIEMPNGLPLAAILRWQTREPNDATLASSFLWRQGARSSHLRSIEALAPTGT